jgi:hypothetical protein
MAAWAYIKPNPSNQNAVAAKSRERVVGSADEKPQCRGDSSGHDGVPDEAELTPNSHAIARLLDGYTAEVSSHDGVDDGAQIPRDFEGQRVMSLVEMRRAARTEFGLDAREQAGASRPRVRGTQWELDVGANAHREWHA